ncbi:ribonuclease E/G [Proteiniclasticum sp. QWL-01]|uniref:ribonuclease E/G n=1 Tax=Proteiniclasticum sp. QWL-01 TaxID=3036945 RepID=UPI0024103524|nr:ribonuclease E/G [Proteiniclasticum sp. QWL-01]WFF71599.1 ribonuclease E/G [Proteiniclasticum sp. QWL-01]
MRQLFIERDGFLRIALTQEGAMKALRVLKDPQQPLEGDIYQATIKNVSSAQSAVFVDLGTGRNAYLYVRSPKALGKYHVGDRLPVEILRSQVGKKGAKVTEGVSLTDGDLVVMAGRGHSYSRNLDRSEFERIHGAPPEVPGFHILYRSGSLNIEPHQLNLRVQGVAQRLRQILDQAEQTLVPGRLYRDLGYLEDLLQDGVDMIHSNDPVISASLRQQGYVVTEYPDFVHLFASHGLEQAVDRLRHKTVALPGGGTLVIEETEALTAIDVNSAARGSQGHRLSAYELNQTALRASLEQIELRSLSGIIVIDFVAMEREADAQRLWQTASELTESMRPLTKAYPLTELGLMQIARRRRGESVNQFLFSREGTRKVPVSPTYLYKLIRIKLDDPAWSMKQFEITLDPIYTLERQALEQLITQDYPDYQIRWEFRRDVDTVKVVPILS